MTVEQIALVIGAIGGFTGIASLVGVVLTFVIQNRASKSAAKKDDLDVLRQAQERLTAELERKEARIADLETERVEWHEERAAWQMERAELLGRLRTFETERAELLERMRGLEAELARLRTGRPPAGPHTGSLPKLT